MISDKAIYWIATVVLALGVGNSLSTAHPDWAQAASERPLMLADAACNRLANLATLADLMFGRSQVGIDRTQVAVARVQSRLASVQARLASREARIARIQQERVLTFTRERMNRMVVDCPKPDPGVDVTVQVDGTDTQ